MDYSTPGFPALHYLQELAQTPVHWISGGHPTNLILCHPLLLPSVFPKLGPIILATVFMATLVYLFISVGHVGSWATPELTFKDESDF